MHKKNKTKFIGLKYLILVTVLIAPPTTHSQNGWVHQSPLPTLNDVAMSADGTGIAVGENGAIRRTIDGGTTWTTHNVGTDVPLRHVILIDGTIGWAVARGEGGVIRANREGGVFRTTNSGQSWIQVEQPSTSIPIAVHFIDANTGWIVGESATILHTKDGGHDWTSIESPTSNDVYGVFFVDEDIGWILSSSDYSRRPPGLNNVMHKTTDRGTTWTEQAAGFRFENVMFLDTEAGWAAGNNGVIYHTSDGGETWERQTNLPLRNLYKVSFVDTQTGWAVGANGSIAQTSDGGNTWALQTSGSMRSLNGVTFVDALTGIAVGTDGTILQTNDGGNTWEFRASSTIQSLYAISSIDHQTAWAVGQRGVIMHTSNGGNTWVPQTSSTNRHLYGITFVNEHTGIAVGANGMILHTSDRGATWVEQESETGAQLSDVHFVDAENGFIIGSRSAILRTKDGGKTWANLVEGTGDRMDDRIRERLLRLEGIHFWNSNIGMIVGEHGTILQTSDGGENWTIPEDVPTGTLNAVALTDENAAIAVGNGGRIIRTTDGGETWSNVESGTTSHLLAVSFADANVGVAVGGSTVIGTDDGGQTWWLLSSAIGGLTGVTMDAMGIITAVGNGGGIIRTEAGLAVSTEDQRYGEQAVHVLLHQNYPNPFNPSTTIVFDLPEAAIVQLVVYDALGRKVATVVSERLAAGRYEQAWEAGHLPSGLYLYRLEAGDYREMRRMVLVK